MAVAKPHHVLCLEKETSIEAVRTISCDAWKLTAKGWTAVVDDKNKDATFRFWFNDWSGSKSFEDATLAEVRELINPDLTFNGARCQLLEKNRQLAIMLKMAEDHLKRLERVEAIVFGKEKK